jgi:hypothetical protein
MTNQGADSQPGQAVPLRERPADDEVPVLSEQRQRRPLAEIGVGLVDDDQGLRRRLRDPLDRAGPRASAARTAAIGNRKSGSGGTGMTRPPAASTPIAYISKAGSMTTASNSGRSDCETACRPSSSPLVNCTQPPGTPNRASHLDVAAA